MILPAPPRRRWKKLDHWKGERIVYKESDDGLPYAVRAERLGVITPVDADSTWTGSTTGAGSPRDVLSKLGAVVASPTKAVSLIE